MLKQILSDMYIDPELLAELDEEQKQLLFCKMREEQVRRWKLREEKEEQKRSVHQKKLNRKKVTFNVGTDGEPLVAVFEDKDDVDSIHDKTTQSQAELEASFLKIAVEDELDRFVRLSRSTVQAMEEEATRNTERQKPDGSLQERIGRLENQVPYFENAELSNQTEPTLSSLVALSLSPSCLVSSNSIYLPTSSSETTLLGIPSHTQNSPVSQVSASLSTLPITSAAFTNIQYNSCPNYLSCPSSYSSSTISGVTSSLLPTLSHSLSPVFDSSTFTERITDDAQAEVGIIPLTLTAAANSIGVADQIKRWEQLSEGSLEETKPASLEEAKKRSRPNEILEQHQHSHLKVARQQQQVAQAAADAKQEMEEEERDETAWQQQERKAKEAEKRIREIARRAREEHRRTSLITPIHAINRNLSGITHDGGLLKNKINDINSNTDTGSDINGNIDNGLDDISNNNKSSSNLERGTTDSAVHDVACASQRLRPPKPPSRASIVAWFREEELTRGAGLDLSKNQIAPWFHGIISRTEAEEVLEKAKVGSFLVRVSERIWGYTISYRAVDRYRHYLIDVTGGRYTFFGSHQTSHETLGELIEYHMREPITTAGRELLIYPCGQINLQRPNYLELFTGTHFLTF